MELHAESGMLAMGKCHDLALVAARRDLQRAILVDLEEGLRRAPNDEARLALMQKVRATLAPAGVLSGPPPTHGVATDAAPAARPREGERE